MEALFGRQSAAIAILVLIKFVVIFVNFVPICAFILFILHNEKYIISTSSVQHDPNDKASVMLAMIKLIASALFETNEGRTIVASWVAVTIVSTIYEAPRLKQS